jgi:lambda family phage portal protein
MANASAIILDSGALEGADKFSRETALWSPSMGSPDQVINNAKPMADARGRDTVRNSGMAYGAVALHKDGIVGAQYRLNATPHWRFLSAYSKGFDETWADEFQQIVEARFSMLADSEKCWLDAQGVNTLTGLVRLAIGVFLITGEVIGSVEWLRKPNRPINTAFQMVSSDRLCNPNGMSDDRFMRRGVERDANGQALAYHFRMGDQFDHFSGAFSATWRRVPAEKPWGRKQVIHIIEQGMMDQTRGISDMVATLKNMRMTKKFAEVTLQNAVINATYAAAIESELPNDMVAAALGQAGGDTNAGMLGMYRSYMGALGEYLDAANNIRIDGAMIPHLFPGTKLNMQPAKTTGGIGTSFEESLLRHTAASLGLSYEEFSRDFSKTNYSSGKAAMGVSQKFMASRKKHVADRFACDLYALVLEEEMSNGNVPLPRGQKRDVFYRDNGMAKEAFTRCQWIGSGSGQVDELRETQAAGLRIAMGISTYALEGARLGIDWRELFEQCARERALMDKYGLTFDMTTTKPTGASATAADPEADAGPKSTEAAAT